MIPTQRNGRKNKEVIEIKMPCKAEYVRTVRRTIAEYAESLNMPHTAIADIEIAASEALANVIRHAYIGTDKIPNIKIKFGHDKDNIMLEIIDNGRGFNAPAFNIIPDVDFDCEGGMGIIIIKLLMDKVNYYSRPKMGTRLKMIKSIPNTVHNHKEPAISRDTRMPLQAGGVK